MTLFILAHLKLLGKLHFQQEQVCNYEFEINCMFCTVIFCK
jgi:hypothetical protein